jgi:GrpB-like predicted nucleotidyltransferase (UPF0157 family)
MTFSMAAAKAMSQFSADRRAVELVPHDPRWSEMARNEADRLSAVLGDIVVSIEHIGSTSIPGIIAKPTIDLALSATSLDALDKSRGTFEAMGYIWRGEFGIPGRRYCPRDHDGKRVFHVHCYANGSQEVRRNCLFRDYLRANAVEAQAYEQVKRAAGIAHPFDTLAYSATKSDWIAACLERAEAWAKR